MFPSSLVLGTRKKNFRTAEPGFEITRKFYFWRCFEPGNFILFRGDLVLRKSSPHVFGEGGRRVAPSPIKVVLRCKRMLSALQITQNRKDPIITARAIHILVRSPEISPKYHQARKKFPWDQPRRKKIQNRRAWFWAAGKFFSESPSLVLR